MLLENPREMREFVAAKRRKREPLILTAEACASAEFKPAGRAALNQFLDGLRGVADWGRATERFEAVARALFDRHAVPMPVPRLVLQNEDTSLTFFWGTDLFLRAFPDGVAFSFLGQRGKLVHGQESERVLLDALRAQKAK